MYLVQSYQLAEDLGKAFSERTVLESILGAEQQAADSKIQRVLGLLRTLYVLSGADEGAVFLRYVTNVWLRKNYHMSPDMQG
jgi:acyl-CoA oxidase